MKPLVLNFIARWWIVLLLIGILTTVTTATTSAFPTLLAPFVLVCLRYDSQRGYFRAVRPLPVSSKQQAMASWFSGVLLAPLLLILPLLFGSLIFAYNNHTLLPQEHLLFNGTVQFWVTLGFGAFCFILATIQPTRPPASGPESIAQVLINLLWIFAITGSINLLTALPKSPDAILPWHWLLFASVPVFLLLSFLAAPNMISRRLFSNVGTTTETRPVPNRKAIVSGLSGVPFFLANFVARFAAIMVFAYVLQALVYRWKGQNSADGFTDSFMLFLLSVIMSVTATGSLNMRALRILPLRPLQLAALIGSIPVGLGLTTALAPLLLHHAQPQYLLLFQTAAIAIGTGIFFQAISLYLSSSWRIGIILIVSMVVPLAMFELSNMPLLFTGLGLLLSISGFALLYRGLRKSPAFYQNQQVSGFNPNQPI